MKKLILFISALLSVTVAISQQKTWTLDECIYHAIDNNLQIKRQELQTKFQKNALDMSKLKLLPTLNASGSENISWGRSLDQTTYQYTDNQRVISNNFNLGGSMDLFNGLQNYHSIKKNEYELLAGVQDLQLIKENISLNVALNYLQILLNKELVLATGEQLQITLQQIEKTKKLVEAGSVALGDLLQIEAQAAQEELQLITLENQLDLSYLDITQLLELSTSEGFEVADPAISIDANTVISETVESVFLIAIGSRPSVLSSELKLTASKYNLKAARGMRSPRLSMNHSVSTSYSDIRQRIIGNDPATSNPIYGDYPFVNQFKDNRNFVLGFTLSIPILNGWQVNKNISNSKVQNEINSYVLDETKKQLYKDIQQAHADASAALKKYAAGEKAVASMEESFRYSEQRFAVGLVTPVDYNASKNQLLKAQSDLAQAKYEYVFKTKVLDFYRGMPLSLN